MAEAPVAEGGEPEDRLAAIKERLRARDVRDAPYDIAYLVVRVEHLEAALRDALTALGNADEFVHWWMQDNTSERELKMLEQIEAAIERGEAALDPTSPEKGPRP